MFMLRLLGRRVTGSTKPCDALISLCPSIFTVVGALALKRRGGRHMAVVHDIQSGLGAALGGGLTRALMPVLQGLERWTLNNVDTVIVLSEEMKQHLRALGVRTPVEIQPPMVNADFIHPAKEPGEPLTLMYSGNLGRKQGLGQVIALAEELARRESPARIVIRGGGAMRDALVAEVAEKQLTNIDIQDLVPRDEIARSLAEAHVHLVPQIASGGDFAVPSKIFSIMAAGRTFVATAEPGSTLAELADQTGAFICVRPDDAAAYADAVETLLADPQSRQRRGAAGRLHVETHADTAVVMTKLSSLLQPGPQIKMIGRETSQCP
jgi:colanic acid biosynthesis glycosyl transferase WcaI